MSPEQARDEAVDHRTDIWSFGAMVYEILTGQMPFGQKHDQTLIYSILNDNPEPPSRLRPEITNHLERIVLKALEKRKLRRYQNMTELLKDLKAARISGLILPKAEKSIIVLPFENISPDPEQEYFCDGMTEEIITDLSHVHDLLVISRSSAMTFKGTKKTIPEIAGAVNVRYVLEGSVRKAGNNLRITAQLIDSSTDAHLWAEKYNGTLDDVFDIQEKVSRSIVEALRLKLTRAEDKQIAKRPLVDIRAYDCYLLARKAIQRFTEEGFDEATRLLQAGLNIVGDNALLYAGPGYAFLASADLGMKPMNAIDKAGDYARKALSLDPDTSQAHMVLGYVQMMHGNQGECIRRCKQALSINPNDYDANMWLSMSLCFVGKTQEAIPITNRMIELDPLDPAGYWMQTFGHFFEGRFVDAYESLRQDPIGACFDLPVFRFWAAYALAYSNRVTEALALLESIKETATTDLVLRCFPLLRCALQGDHELMTELVTEDIVAAASIDCMKAGFLTSFYAILGDKGSTFEWPGQRIFVVNVDNYAYIVPFIEDEKTIFLKTIIPSRKMTRKYLGGSRHENK